MTPRMTGLLLLLGAVVAVRWTFPPRTVPAEFVEAVVRPPSGASNAPAAPVRAAVTTVDPMPEAVADEPGNAFAARIPPAAPAPPPPPPVKTVAVTAPPPAPADLPPPAPPPPPPVQVIGTWDDGSTPGVFLSGPQGAMFARAGTTLMSQYRVIQVSAHQVSIMQLSTKYEWQLAIPRTTPRR